MQMMKWIGGILIILACGLFGVSLVREYRREEDTLRQLIGALDYMQCELQYRMTALPDLCRQAGEQNGKMIGQVLVLLAQELECMVSPDVQSCVMDVMEGTAEIPPKTRSAFESLGKTLGRFDLSGQIQGLDGVRNFCRGELEHMMKNKEARLRNYRTLSLCAGAALAVLFV